MSKVQISKVQISKVQISKVQISKVQISKVQISKVQISKVLQWDETHTFVPMDLEDKEKGTAKKSGGTRKKTLTRKSAELRSWLKVAQDDEESMNPKILYTNADGSASHHANIQVFLRRLDREDLSTLYRLVKERFQDHPLEGHDLMLWGDLRMIFDPDKKDDIWMNQLDWKVLKWKLHENYGVHTLFMDGTPMQINMLVEKKIDRGEVIKNGNKVLRRTIGTVEQVYEPTTAEEKQDRRNEMKAKATLLMALPNNDQLKFHSYQDAKLLIEAIEKRLQKLISQLEIQREVIYQEDMNLKLLRSLPSKWKTHALIWRNKVEIETISIDVLYNNLKIYEPEITGSSSTSQNSQNVTFVSNNTNNTNNTNKADDTAHGVSTTHTQKDLEQLHPDDLEEMDLQWGVPLRQSKAEGLSREQGGS
ncbi:hypothetical protein Tco_0132244 [Tanacetum coccineum]